VGRRKGNNRRRSRCEQAAPPRISKTVDLPWSL